jgi:cryptochrome
MPAKYIYEPWEAPASVQKTAGVIIGKDYPIPIVDHKTESKENMSKMAYFYDLHKNGDGKKKTGAEKKTVKKKSVTKATKDAPARKKRKVQQTLKF